MADRRENLILTYLCKTCSAKKTCLISPHAIAQNISKKMLLSTSEIDEVMTNLSMQNYIDFVATDWKNGYYYCVKLKSKGQTYLQDKQKSRKALGLLVLRSIFLASVSFVFGLILKAIFKA